MKVGDQVRGELTGQIGVVTQVFATHAMVKWNSTMTSSSPKLVPLHLLEVMLPPPAAGPWVPVTERMPTAEDGQPTWYSREPRFLVTDGEFVGHARYDEERGCWFDDTADEPRDGWTVTHWAPLRLPKGKS